MIPDFIHKIGNLLSLTLTTPTILSGLMVVILFWKTSFMAMAKWWREGRLQPYMWLSLGVGISFFGDVSDNAWWGSAWGRYFIEHPSWHWWFDNGVFSNIPFRQLCGIMAAMCHLKSVWSDDKDAWKLKAFNYVMIIGTIVTLFGLIQVMP